MPSDQAYIVVTNDGSQINVFVNARLVYSRAANEEWSIDFWAEPDHGPFEERVDDQ